MPASTTAAIPLTANTTLKDSIAWASDLPALPAALLDLLALVGSDDVDIDELCARISVDMALTAKLLRLANSSFYGGRGAVTSVDAAIARVGLRMVKGIVGAAAASGTIKPPACKGFDFTAFWRHGVATATAAQALAFATGADPSTAFTSGLLYRIGQLVLVLGSRLRQVTGLVLAVEGRSAAEIMGSPDDMKLRSSMTLFAHAAVDGALFQTVLERYFDGKADQATTALLGAGQG